MSQDEYFFYFLKVLKFKWVLLVFTIFGCFWRTSKIKFLLISLKSLTNCENPSCNPLHEAFYSFLIAACESKSCSKSRVTPWNCSERQPWMLFGEFPPIRLKIKKLMRLSWQSPELVSVFKEQAYIFYLYFLFIKAYRLKVQTLFALVQAFEKISSWWPNQNYEKVYV